MQSSRTRTVIISGVHSGPDPSPGLGIARSLRAADASINLVGKDYSLRSSGLHDLVFDEIMLMPAWSEMDLAAHRQRLEVDLSERDALYISGLDAEIDWLSTIDIPRHRILNPSRSALTAIQKPDIQAASMLGMRIPDHLPAKADPMDVQKLGRKFGWNLWVKGKFHEAYSARSYKELSERLLQMQASWPLKDIFIQRGISGLERSYCFAAFSGELLGLVEVEKRNQTSLGKTWAASVTPPTERLTSIVSALVLHTNWTGGGEIEFIRDERGGDWLIDVNPRFPAYIHGITICGLNLPALLFSSTIGLRQPIPRSYGGQFTRVVSEIPTRDDFPIPPITNSSAAIVASLKHPSFQPALVNKRAKESGQTHTDKRVRRIARQQGSSADIIPTSRRISRADRVDDILEPIVQFISRNAGLLSIRPALSIKTDPRAFSARAYLERGWYSEAISKAEADWAQAQGFLPESIILNGPLAVATKAQTSVEHRYCFADSIESFATLCEYEHGTTVGLRLRPGKVASRFGISLADYTSFISTLDALDSVKQDITLAVHMHLPADQLGPQVWLDCAHEVLHWASILQTESGVRVSAFDFGGGWHADDLVDSFLPILESELIPKLDRFPELSELIFEPGKAIASNTADFDTGIAEVRAQHKPDCFDVVVTGSIADLPMTQYYAHEILHCRAGEVLGRLSAGGSRILGAICMESDILATGIGFPAQPLTGDRLIFRGAGGYNSSMSWHFGKGLTRDQ